MKWFCKDHRKWRCKVCGSKKEKMAKSEEGEEGAGEDAVGVGGVDVNFVVNEVKVKPALLYVTTLPVGTQALCDELAEKIADAIVNQLVLKQTTLTASTSTGPSNGIEEGEGSSGSQKRMDTAENLGQGQGQAHVINEDQIACEVFRDLDLDDSLLTFGKLQVLRSLPPDDPAFLNIQDYITRGQEHNFGIRIISILQLESCSPLVPDCNKLSMMLWHGSRKDNVASILKNGFKLSDTQTQVSTAGIHFADRVSKSCQYCDGTWKGCKGYLVLCDVQLGRVFKSYGVKAPGPILSLYDSVQRIGWKIPDSNEEKIINGCVWPLGRTVYNLDEPGTTTLNFNEYIVCKLENIKPKYLVKVEFESKA